MTKDTKITIFTLLGTAVLFGTMVYAPEITDYAKMKIDGWKGKASKKDDTITASNKFTITEKGMKQLTWLNSQEGYYGNDLIFLQNMSDGIARTKEEIRSTIKQYGIGDFVSPTLQQVIDESLKDNFITIIS